MNKTVTINISGLIFNIDETAYSRLRDYLENIEKYFKSSEGGDEIMTDIEGRIAEMFNERISDRKEVISLADVEQMIEVMGQPEQFVDEETREETQRRATQSEPQEETFDEEFEQDESFDPGPKRFFRDPDGRILGGVCSGIGYYFGIDPVIIRLLFVLAVLLGFSGVLIYVIFWIITPKAQTRAEKLQMKGRKVNIDNIRQTVKKEADSVKKNFNNIEGKVNDAANSPAGRRVGNFISTFGNFVFNVLRNLLWFAGKLIGAVILFFGSMALIGMAMSFIGISVWDGMFSINGTSYSLSFGEASQFFFDSSWLSIWTTIGFALALCMPLVFFIILGVRMVFGIKNFARPVGFGLLGLWILGIILSFATSTIMVKQFSKGEELSESVSLPPTTADTLNVYINEALLPTWRHRTNPNDFFNLARINEQSLELANVQLDVVESKSDSIEIRVIRKSRGNSYKDAKARAENIEYGYNIEGGNLIFDPVFKVTRDDKYRLQEVEIHLGIPVGKTVYLSENSNWIIYDIENVTNTHDSRMLDKYWTMTDDGLACLHCNFMGNTDRGVNGNRDMNSMNVRELERELERLSRKLERKLIDNERKVRRKTTEFERKILQLEKQISNTTNEFKLKDLELRMKELKADMNGELKSLQIELDGEVEQLRLNIQELSIILDNKNTEEEKNSKEEKTTSAQIIQLEDDAPNEPILKSRLFFPNPFRILI